jgi:hypothetical protein
MSRKFGAASASRSLVTFGAARAGAGRPVTAHEGHSFKEFTC